MGVAGSAARDESEVLDSSEEDDGGLLPRCSCPPSALSAPLPSGSMDAEVRFWSVSSACVRVVSVSYPLASRRGETRKGGMGETPSMGVSRPTIGLWSLGLPVNMMGLLFLRALPSSLMLSRRSAVVDRFPPATPASSGTMAATCRCLAVPAAGPMLMPPHEGRLVPRTATLDHDEDEDAIGRDGDECFG